MINKILLVDDETAFLSGFVMALNRVCHFHGEIKTSTNGSDAIREIDSNNIDLCFLDVNLPDISGIDVMKHIRESSPDTRVVIMTASVLDDEMKEDINRDACLFISKPVELETIKDFLNRELQAVSGSHSNGTSCSETLNNEKRHHERISCSKIVTYSVSIYYDWKLRSGITAKIIDISQGGVGFITDFPVTTGNVITFTEGFPDKKGIVRWWTKDLKKYRAGIKYI